MFLLKLTRMLGTIYCLCIVINNHLSGGVVSGFSDVCSFIGKFPSFRGGPHSSVTYGKVPHLQSTRTQYLSSPARCPSPPPTHRWHHFPTQPTPPNTISVNPQSRTKAGNMGPLMCRAYI